MREIASYCPVKSHTHTQTSYNDNHEMARRRELHEQSIYPLQPLPHVSGHMNGGTATVDYPQQTTDCRGRLAQHNVTFSRCD